jgi:hypothetical protein
VEADEHPPLAYEFSREVEARGAAAELDRRFAAGELKGLRIYRVRWSGNYLVEAVFSNNTPDSRLHNARALLGESGAPVHPEDLRDYKKATERGGAGGLPDWIRRLLGG